MRIRIAVLAALLLLALACMGAAGEAPAGPEAFRGNWELYSISLMGVTLNRSDLSYNVICNIHEDDTAAFAMDQSYFVAPVSYEEGMCLLHEGSDVSRLTLDAEGLLCLTMVSDGVKMQLRMQRAEVSEPSAEIAQLVGRWELDSATAMGLHLSEADIGEVAATIYPDHYGLLQLGEETLGLLLMVEDGAVVMLEEGLRSDIHIDAEGRMVICRQSGPEDAAITLTLRRASTAASAAPVAFGGVWQAVRVRVMGAELPLQAEALRLEISGSLAILSAGDAQHVFTVTGGEDACMLENEVIRCRCTIGEDGLMMLTVPVFDVIFILAPQTD